MTGDVITFTGVQKRYATQQVLSGVDLSIREGEFLGLVGVNGAGKTTCIKCLLDFSSANAGEIRLFGRQSHDVTSRARLAYLPEKFMPPYYLTGADFLRFMTALYGVAPDGETIRRILQVLDFDPAALKKSVRQLSKGMAQKLGLAACLLSGRELLVLDEPMSGLDPRARAWLKQHLLELKQHGQTLFFSTHLLSDVEVLCDRVAILHRGTIRFTGTPAECCAHYQAADLEQAYLHCVADKPEPAGARE